MLMSQGRKKEGQTVVAADVRRRICGEIAALVRLFTSAAKLLALIPQRDPR
jgi:hypothetical protein